MVEVSLSQLESGAVPRPRSGRVKDKERRAQEVEARFVSNTITLEEYVRAMSQHVGF